MNRKFIGGVWWSFVLCLLAAIIVTLAGCARGLIERPTRAGDENARRAELVLTFVSGRACNLEDLRCANTSWERSGWHNLMDVTDPILVVVDGANNACPVWRDSVRSPRRGEFYRCPGSWRIWRRP